jgi:cupin superfamily acireductone dioxygenase involved in methionine salvage
MPNEINLQQMISALDEMDFENRTNNSLEHARTQAQMTGYLSSLDYSLKRLQLLQNAVNDLVEQKRSDQVKQEKIQTYKTKIFNLAKQYGISYSDVLTIMATLNR